MIVFGSADDGGRGARAFVIGTKGADVTRFQQALNREARPRFHPTIAEDGTVGSVTLYTFNAIGWAIGLGASELDPAKVTVEAQQLVIDPRERKPRHLAAERRRVRKLHR